MIDPVASPTPKGNGAEKASELKIRVLSAIALALLALGSAWYGGLIFAVVWGVAAIAVLSEWQGVIGFSGRKQWFSVAIGAAGLIFSIGLLVWKSVPTLIGFAPVILAGLINVGAFRRPSLAWPWLFFGPLYAAAVVLGPMMVRAREPEGLIVIVWLFLVVWISDIGAFFVGRRIGGPKLWPSVSPKKTWSGFIGGLLSGTVVPIFAVYAAKLWLAVEWLEGWPLILLTLTTALVSECGDLFESAMKRRFGVKDTGNLIPGHGGIMDRLDSYTAAAFYLLLVMGIFSV